MGKIVDVVPGNLKVGMKVRAYGSAACDELEKGKIGEVTTVQGDTFYINGCNHTFSGIGSHYKLEIISENNMLNIKEKMALIFKGEPEKSFIKAGVMNVDETLTSDGEDIFMAWLLKKNGDDFKKEVVDPILADQGEE